MGVILISKLGGYKAHIDELFVPSDERYSYRIREINIILPTEKRAIRKARTYLKKQRKLFKQGKIPPIYERVKRFRKSKIESQKLKIESQKLKNLT